MTVCPPRVQSLAGFFSSAVDRRESAATALPAGHNACVRAVGRWRGAWLVAPAQTERTAWAVLVAVVGLLWGRACGARG